MAHDEQITTGATYGNKLLRNLLPPGDEEYEQTQFTNLRWRATIAYRTIGSMSLFQTRNGRHWAAAGDRLVEDTSDKVSVVTYSAASKNAPAMLFDGRHPHDTPSWELHNLITIPSGKGPSVQAAVMHIGAALAIMHTRGDIGEPTGLLRPVRHLYEFEQWSDTDRSHAFALADDGSQAIAVVNTAHLRSDTTSIEGFGLTDSNESHLYTSPEAIVPKGADHISMSMFGRPAPSAKEFIERLIASAACMIRDA